jgi:subtilase family serine protease
MTSPVQLHKRKQSSRAIEDAAARWVVESLECRCLLSGGAWTKAGALAGGTHATSAAVTQAPVIGHPRTDPYAIMPAGIIRGGTTAPVGYTVTQMRHLYGLDQLDTPFDPNFPLYLNNGDGQNVVVVGASTIAVGELPDPTTMLPVFFDVETLNPTMGPPGGIPPSRRGDIDAFSSAMGIPTTSAIENFAQPEKAPDDPTRVDDTIGGTETTMEVEWAHAMAPAASIFTEYVNSTNGDIAPADLAVGIQAAIDLLSTTEVPPFSNGSVGGVVVLSLSSVAEIAANQALFDSLFTQADAANISFVCSAGDVGGALSMPGVSPFVTSIGGTVYQIDGAGNRISESAWLSGGGGQSTIEPLPAYQQGLKLKKKPLTGGRAVPDFSMAARSRGTGIDVFYDPTASGNLMRPWFTFEGTSCGAAIFGGVLADANELRASFGMPVIGRQVNAKLYNLYMQNPNLYFHDITQGNNTKFNATKGFDLATGMGAPNFDQIIPGLADTVSSIGANVHFNGNFIAPLGTGLTGPAITVFRGTGTINIGTQFVTLNLGIASTDGLSTATLAIPQISRQLDNSIEGMGTVTVTTTDPTTGMTATLTLNVEFTGKVSRTNSRRPRVSGQIFTVDPLTGQRLNQGSLPIFQGTFST